MKNWSAQQKVMVLLCAWAHTSLCVPPFLVLYLLLLTLIQGSCFLAWWLTFSLWTEIATSIYRQLAKSTLWWPRALQLAACAVCGPGDMVLSLGQISASFSTRFLWLRQREASGKLEATGACDLAKWPEPGSPLIAGIFPGKEREWG